MQKQMVCVCVCVYGPEGFVFVLVEAWLKRHGDEYEICSISPSKTRLLHEMNLSNRAIY